jgi:lysozyme
MIRDEFALKEEDNRVWSKEELVDIFTQDLVRFECGVLRLAPNLDGRQGAFDACVSFSFNAGLGNFQRSAIRMKNNRGEFEAASDEFLKWVKGGGKVLPGLVKRRQDERKLYLS